MTIRIEGGRVLRGGGYDGAPLVLEGAQIADPGHRGADAELVDAQGCLVLPGIVDIHGDAFERQIMPRPKVTFPLDVGLRDTDRQLVSNGITTAFHGVTVSWEPGLRSLESARALIGTLTAIRPSLGCDTRLHIRWETFAFDAIEDVERWISADPQVILAFNDHTTATIEKAPASRKTATHAQRAGLTLPEYEAMLEAMWERREAVPAAIERLAAHTRAVGAVLLAHDERTVEERLYYRALGAVASEFPMYRETAQAARDAGEHTVLGAPNVVRGGSHNGMMDATSAVADGLCTVLTSDYYYPAPLLAAFKLAADGVTDLASAWRLVSANAAEAAGLTDRGTLDPGRRADVILVDDEDPRAPRVVAAYVAGRRVYAAG